MVQSKRIRLDKQQKQAHDEVMIGESLFITGKAGTGKTELLKRIYEDLVKQKKVVAVLAPTGIAAENAHGYTMHNFLRLPLKPYLPEHKTNPGLYQLSDNVERIVRSLDVLIIDEISMVRCDMLDATDMILRHYRKNRKPFGDVQLIMFGDLFQLCPIAKQDEERTLKKYYKGSLYFFSCYAFKRLKYKVIHLETIHRQEEREFINVLNNVRVADVDIDDLKLLNSRVEPDFSPKVTENVVTLMTHNKMTDDWNNEMFDKLKKKVKIYDGAISGNWYGERLPAKYHLILKVGARVMFLRNDNEMGRYKNGTMGWVKALYTDKIVVTKDNGDLVDVDRATWEQLDYYIDEKTKTISSYPVGRYTQFPLKLAWAVSIHKSQGLTFDEVAINASKSFTFGQVYVALSRCRTLSGVHLLSSIPYHKIIADPIVKQYMESITKDGYVKLPKAFEPIKYEKKNLIIRISDKKFDRIYFDGVKTYKHSVDSEFYASQLFQYEKGKLKVQPTFEHIKKEWNFWDLNNGSLPFITRHYKKATFECSTTGLSFDAEIESEIDFKVSANDYWQFSFKIGKLSKYH